MASNPNVPMRYPPTLGANDLMEELVAMLIPRMVPVSFFETLLVTAAVMIELIRQSAHVKGRRRARKPVISVTKVWNRSNKRIEK